MKSIWTFLLLGFMTQPAIFDRSIIPCEEAEEGAESCTLDESSE